MTPRTTATRARISRHNYKVLGAVACRLERRVAEQEMEGGPGMADVDAHDFTITTCWQMTRRMRKKRRGFMVHMVCIRVMVSLALGLALLRFHGDSLEDDACLLEIFFRTLVQKWRRAYGIASN